MSWIKSIYDKLWVRYVLLILPIIFMTIIGYCVYDIVHSSSPNPETITFLLIIELVLFIFTGIYITTNRLYLNINFNLFNKFRPKSNKLRVPKLRRRIIIAFSIGTAIPAIIVAIFSIYFFNKSVENWFSESVTNALEQSVRVGHLYVEEHKLQLKETSISMAEDLSDMYLDIAYNSKLFAKVLNAQAEMRGIDEAIIFQRNTHSIVAQTSLSFSLNFLNIPNHILDKADDGEIVTIQTDPSHIRMLIKLRSFNDTYMVVGRLVDLRILDHIDKTDGAVAKYNKLKSEIDQTQIKFAFIFIAITSILIIFSIVGGRNFADRLVRPIRLLVIAAEKAKFGNFNVRVPEGNLKQDEIRVLASAFNRMLLQIDRQQKEISVAKKSEAWSDVARQVAHEVKNPLTPIQLTANRLYSKFIDQVEDKELFKKCIDNIINKSDEIKVIVSEFVNYAKMPAPHFDKGDIVNFVATIVDSRRLIHSKINYIFNSDSKNITLAFDPTQISRALENLLQNAEQAINSKRIAVGNGEKFQPTINISIEHSRNRITIFIADNGDGVDENILSKVKEAYVTTKKDGTGLGLAIVDRIMNEHYGDLKIYNNNNGGVTARLSFDTYMLNKKIKQ